VFFFEKNFSNSTLIKDLYLESDILTISTEVDKWTRTVKELRIEGGEFVVVGNGMEIEMKKKMGISDITKVINEATGNLN